jgi:hypothetical protein
MLTISSTRPVFQKPYLCEGNYVLPMSPTREYNYFLPQSLFLLSEQCVSCAVRPEYLNIIQLKFTHQWTLLRFRQFIPWPSITDPQVPFQIIPCDICGTQIGTGTGIPPSTSCLPVNFIPLMLRTHLHLHVTLTRKTSE